MIIGTVGLIALWIEKIPSLVPLVADGLAALFFLAGGIAWAIGMKDQSCTLSSLQKLYDNPLLNQGCDAEDSNGDRYCFVAGKQDQDPWPLTNIWPDPMKGICQKAFANEAFQFLGFGAAIVLIILGFLALKKRGTRSKFVA